MTFIVKEFELALLSPAIRKDAEALNQLLADDFFEFTQSGSAHTKKDIVDVLPTLPEENFSVRDYQEKRLSDNIVLVHYVADRLVTDSGQRKCTLCSSVWRLSDNRWQMIFFQGTPAKT